MNKASKGVHRPGEKSSCEMPRREPAGYSCRDLKVSLVRRSRRRDSGRKAREEVVFKPLMHGTTAAPLTRCLLSECLRMALHAAIALCDSNPFWRGLPPVQYLEKRSETIRFRWQERGGNCETMLDTSRARGQERESDGESG